MAKIVKQSNYTKLEPIDFTKETTLYNPLTFVMMRGQLTPVEYQVVTIINERLQSLFSKMIREGKKSLVDIRELNEGEGILRLDTDIKINLKDDLIVPIPFKAFGVPANNYFSLKKALKDVFQLGVAIPYLDKKNVRYKSFESLCSVTMPDAKYNKCVYVKVRKDVARLLLSIEIGYTSFYQAVRERIKKSTRYPTATLQLYDIGCAAVNKKSAKEIVLSKEAIYGQFNLLYKDPKTGEMKNAFEDDFRRFQARFLKPKIDEINKLADNGECDIKISYKKVYDKGQKGGWPKYIVITAEKADCSKSLDELKALALMRNQWSSIFQSQFGIKPKTADRLSFFITGTEMIDGLYKKMNYIHQYIERNKNQIKDISKYVEDSLMNYFSELDSKELTLDFSEEDGRVDEDSNV